MYKRCKYKSPFLNISKLTFVFIFFFLSTNSNAQNFENVDAIVEKYPRNITSTAFLAKQIETNFSSDTEKVRALFTWLTKNIRYDLKEFYSGKKQYVFRYSSQAELREKQQKKNDEIINNTLKRKKAVCEGYARTFQKVCELLNIECEFISGYTKTAAQEIGRLPLGGKHAWNSVKINNQWKLVDATWGAGYAETSTKWIREFNPHYFFTPPSELIASHFPKNKKWQLLPRKINQKTFANQPLFTSEYFKQNIKISKPIVGILPTKKDFITIAFEKIAYDAELSYAYEKDYYMTTVVAQNVGNQTVIKIPALGKNKTILNILSNGEVIISYKIP